MIAWVLGRAASAVVRACGGDSHESAAMGLWFGSLFLGVDPLGAALNFAHSAAQFKAADGSKFGKAVSIGMSILVLGDGLTDLGDAAASAGDSAQTLGESVATDLDSPQSC